MNFFVLDFCLELEVTCRTIHDNGRFPHQDITENSGRAGFFMALGMATNLSVGISAPQ